MKAAFEDKKKHFSPGYRQQKGIFMGGLSIPAGNTRHGSSKMILVLVMSGAAAVPDTPRASPITQPVIYTWLFF
jgi:hypothetical protein